MDEPANPKSSRVRTFSPMRVVLASLIGITVMGYVLISAIEGPHRAPDRLVCMAHLKSFGVAFSVYAEEHSGAYPPPDQWCDLLVPKYALQECLRCPKGGDGRCHYAMNPRATPRSAPDVVLLFESPAGWNQSGGSELLTMEHHTSKAGGGCNVLFVDYHSEFVKAENIPRLKWEGERSRPQGSQPPEQPK